MTSKVKKMLLQEASTLDADLEFKRLQKENPVADVLLMFRHENGHIHSVLPDSDISKDMLKTVLINEFGIDSDSSTKVEKGKLNLPKKIIFTNRQAIGDILMFTCAVRDFKAAFPKVEVQVRSTVMHIWDFNPNINQDTWAEVIDPMSFNPGTDKPNAEGMIKLNQKALKVAIERDKPALIYIGPGKLTNASNRKDLHFANAYRISMETMLGVHISQGPIRPDIYLSEAEYSAPPIIEPPYWLITAGEKGDWTCKTFAFSKWQEVIEKLPQIKFVQLGSTGHKHPELSGGNVVNFVGKTQDRNQGLRMLFNLFNNCEGSMGLVSFQMHLAAAFNKPCITIAGAREPVHFTRYPGQGGYLAVDGCLPCTVDGKGSPRACWYCKIDRCPNKRVYGKQEIPLCADLFTSDDVVRAVLRYYEGGRLNFDKPIGVSKLVNIIKDPDSTVVKIQEVKSDEVPDSKRTLLEDMTQEEFAKLISSIEGKKKILHLLQDTEVAKKEVTELIKPTEIKVEKPVEPKDELLWGFEFGGGSITDRDWEFMKTLIKENNVRTVLEFGAGLSTLLLNDLGLDVITYEVGQGWIDKIKDKNPKCNIIQWDGITVPEILPDGPKPKYDFAFVDGPAGGASREFSTKYASDHSDLVIIHDAGREWEKKWQSIYLKNDFYLASKGGHRCHLWRRGKLTPVVFAPDPDKSLIKVVFNGRGEGGAERSVCWIMRQFIERGWEVQYISPNPQPCGTFRVDPIKGVDFRSDLSLVKDPCDILLLYTNDWVWEFPKLTDIFSNIAAKRKVMAVNYKVGNIAKLDWCQNWDHYLFLNSTLMEGTKQVGTVMAPPTDLSIYFDNNPNYEGNLKIVRHSSQGDIKYPKDFGEMVFRILDEIPESEIFLMPAPSFLSNSFKTDDMFNMFNERVHIHKRNQPSVKEFLSQGNCFWYALPGGGYSEGGPKVIMEAQASGLAVIADNHSGAIDRLRYTSGVSGFLCNSFEEHLAALKELANNPDLRKVMGDNGKLHAKKIYNPQYWVNQIIDGAPLSVQQESAEDFICTPTCQIEK